MEISAQSGLKVVSIQHCFRMDNSKISQKRNSIPTARTVNNYVITSSSHLWRLYIQSSKTSVGGIHSVITHEVTYILFCLYREK